MICSKKNMVVKVIKLIIFSFVFIIFLLLTYFFGSYLLKGSFSGNDYPFALELIKWANKWFPNQPIWFNWECGGVPFVFTFPFGPTYLVILINKITSLTLVQAMKLLDFFIYPFIASGIFLFTWTKFKNFIVAILAGILYLISHVSWSWDTEFGLYAEVISLGFFPWLLIIYDRYLSQKNRIYFVLGVAILTILGRFHLVTTVLAYETLFFYSLFYGENWRIGFKKYLLFSITAIILSSFWFVPTLIYRSHIGEFGSIAVEGLRYQPLPSIFGLKNYPTNNVWPMSFAYPVTILAFIGILFALIRRRKNEFFIGLIALIFLFQAWLPGLAPQVVKPLVAYFSIVQDRSIIPAIFLWPIIASLGAYLLVDTLLFFLKNTTLFKKFLINGLTLILTGGLIFGFFGVIDKEVAKRYALEYKGYGPNTSNNWKIPWPPSISEKGSAIEASLKNQSSYIPNNPLTRIDISPSLGYQIQSWNLFSDSSQVVGYGSGICLNRAFQGYQRQAFYLEPDTSTSEEVLSLSKYFGLKYIIFWNKDDFGHFGQETWEDIFQQEGVVIKKFKQPDELATLTNKPAILLLGQATGQNYVFEKAFRAANKGAIPYDLGFLIESKPSGNLNDYTLDELRQYDAIVLYGYTYKDKEKAMELLDSYVKEGGRLFIETGWQFVSPDWQRETTESFFPVQKYSWMNFGTTWDIPNFSPPLYYDKPWGMGVADLSDLKSWAEPVLTQGDKVLIARGNYGQGKIVWSGMMLWGHALLHQNTEELKVSQELIKWLLDGRIGGENQNLVINRTNPDKVEFV
ncbi:MAG: 6-pyruvoyl-tetrahydropterin synthase-related protein, partial [Candidatus Gottesmanbacteria bacterium]